MFPKVRWKYIVLWHCYIIKETIPPETWYILGSRHVSWPTWCLITYQMFWGKMSTMCRVLHKRFASRMVSCLVVNLSTANQKVAGSNFTRTSWLHLWAEVFDLTDPAPMSSTKMERLLYSHLFIHSWAQIISSDNWVRLNYRDFF